MMTDTEYMQLAISLASKGRYTTSPNPMVGCVIVKDGVIVGQGYHMRAGGAHAEIEALKVAGSLAEGATMYLNLEPCCHYGRTPPCVDALRAAGISSVFIATLDPNPLVSGKGVEKLRESGIDVHIGLLEHDAKLLNEVFFHYITTKKPFITLKWAMSLDGKTIVNDGDDRQLSSDETIEQSHQLRWCHDAIMVGAETVRRDNPQLTARYIPVALQDQIKQPKRIVITSDGNLPPDSRVFDVTLAPTLVATSIGTSSDWIDELMQKGVEVLILPTVGPHQLDLAPLFETLGSQQITSVLVEGGRTLHDAILSNHHANKLITYVTGTLIGSLVHKKSLSIASIEKLKHDIAITAYPKLN